VLSELAGSYSTPGDFSLLASHLLKRHGPFGCMAVHRGLLQVRAQRAYVFGLPKKRGTTQDGSYWANRDILGYPYPQKD
jgi:hypothetical protein